MTLEKATIQTYDPDTGALGDEIKVLFNPTNYRLTRSNQFAEVAIPGLEAAPIQFVRGGASSLSMQLFFDTYEKGLDVRDYTDQVTGLMDIDPDLHAPPVCLFAWGDLIFIGVLERADQQFTLFMPDGTPVRATMDVTFKEYFDQPGDRQSATYAKVYVVRRGDTLSSIAAARYGDPAQWRHIARENNIDDPFGIKPGQVLVIPALR
jgi:nucleoid-associated protein YgaU